MIGFFLRSKQDLAASRTGEGLSLTRFGSRAVLILRLLHHAGGRILTHVGYHQRSSNPFDS